MATGRFLKLATPPDPARAKLASAIGAVRQAEARSSAARAVVARADKLVRDASAKASAATSRAASARDAANLRASLTATLGRPPTSDELIHEVRRREDAAALELDATTKDYTHLIRPNQPNSDDDYRGQRTLDEARRRRDTAAANVDTARTLTAYLAKRDDEPVSEDTARDELAAAEAALAANEGNAADCEYQLQRAQTRLDEAVKTIMRGGIDDAIDDMRAAIVQLTDAWAVLNYLKRFEEWSPHSNASERKIDALLSGVQDSMRAWSLGHVKKDTATEPWRHAYEALKVNADTPLPSAKART
ncbi:hypothetical protein SAMN05444161_3559 [Rhizobiales bacterium GAS191]|nr:hypothetical protein SAMN05444161_3559 [Rhizobiales bacterium GAS191]